MEEDGAAAVEEDGAAAVHARHPASTRQQSERPSDSLSQKLGAMRPCTVVHCGDCGVLCACAPRTRNPNPTPIPRAARAHCTLSDDVVWRGSSISPRTRSHPETETESRESRVWRVASDSGIIRKEKESLSKSPIESGAERPRSRSRSSTVNHQKPLHNTE